MTFCWFCHALAQISIFSVKSALSGAINLFTRTEKSFGALSISPDGASDLGMCSRVNPLGIIVVDVCMTMKP